MMPQAQEALKRRINDLLDLMQNVCEFYLLSPADNARAVFILVDDLCELILKSQLEEAAKQRQAKFKALVHQNNFLMGEAHKVAFRQFLRREITEAQFRSDVGAASSERAAKLNSYLTECGKVQDWSEDKGEGFKSFDEVAQEVKDLRPQEPPLHKLLNMIVGRRTTRNRLFHDQSQAGLTVSEEKCLDAVLDLFELAESLWGQEFIQAAQSNAVVRAQLAILRFKLKSRTRGYLTYEYNTFISKQRKPKLNKSSRSYESHVLHDDATAFFNRLKGRCEDWVTRCRNNIARLQAKHRPPSDLAAKIKEQEEIIAVYEEVLRECFGEKQTPPAS